MPKGKSFRGQMDDSPSNTWDAVFLLSIPPKSSVAAVTQIHSISTSLPAGPCLPHVHLTLSSYLLKFLFALLKSSLSISL